ncbi:hypothetical protein BT96DRAFT_927975 [Gymnopus androsaceus JB14]|uniref:Uncharacterized protein n=1 Tax=Gymnopus androsaceus JB14 TaxID=1447944 RepID=A0A6A4GM54_9AGAR|nr:hypothetical protein BT96DRAFT_927975 [Gymnopus androsaceus JB14]
MMLCKVSLVQTKTQKIVGFQSKQLHFHSGWFEEGEDSEEEQDWEDEAFDAEDLLKVLKFHCELNPIEMLCFSLHNDYFC